MSHLQTQRWRTAPPKTILVKNFISLVEGLNDFMPGLQTIRRSIRTKVITEDGNNELEGNECWKVYQPFVYGKIEQLQFELTLHKTKDESCELHVEFRKNHVMLSVSDIGTGWRDAVFEEIERRLKQKDLFKGDLIYKLASTIIRLQNILLISGASLLLLTILKENFDFKYFSTSLLATGLIPVLSDIYRLYFPPKPISVLEDKPPFPIWSIERFAMWVGIFSGILTLAKELSAFLGGKG